MIHVLFCDRWHTARCKHSRPSHTPTRNSLLLEGLVYGGMNPPNVMVSHIKKLSTQGLVLPQAVVEETVSRCGVGVFGDSNLGGRYHRKRVAVLFQVVQTSTSPVVMAV